MCITRRSALADRRAWVVGILRAVDMPSADPAKLLAYWMEWERGETPPGRVISNLKTAGLRELLEQLASEGAPGQ
jgi:hypothetical protein